MKPHVLLGWFCLLALAASCGEKDACETSAHCLEGSVCRQGQCVPLLEGGCELVAEGEDGCDAYHVCQQVHDLTDPAPYVCVRAASCAGGCAVPARGLGGVCNVGGLWEAKAADVCLSERCESTSDCAENSTCVRPPSGGLGHCSSGFPDEPCFGNADCFFDRCAGARGTQPGACLGPRAGQAGASDDPGAADSSDDDIVDDDPAGPRDDCEATGGTCFDGFCSDLGLQADIGVCEGTFEFCCR